MKSWTRVTPQPVSGAPAFLLRNNSRSRLSQIKAMTGSDLGEPGSVFEARGLGLELELLRVVTNHANLALREAGRCFGLDLKR